MEKRYSEHIVRFLINIIINIGKNSNAKRLSIEFRVVYHTYIRYAEHLAAAHFALFAGAFDEAADQLSDFIWIFDTLHSEVCGAFVGAKQSDIADSEYLLEKRLLAGDVQNSVQQHFVHARIEQAYVCVKAVLIYGIACKADGHSKYAFSIFPQEGYFVDRVITSHFSLSFMP